MYYNYTPLHYAVKSNHLIIVEYLIEHNANIKSKNNIGSTPLHIAAEIGALEIVEYMIKHGSYIDELDSTISPQNSFQLHSIEHL